MSFFFVTGLPRSRTAWLANFLTTDYAICSHGGLLECAGNVQDFERMIKVRTNARSGDASPSLLICPIFESIAQKFHKAKWVFIRRDVKEVCASHKKAFPKLNVPDVFFHEMAKTIDLFAPSVDSVVIDFNDLDKPEVCDKIHHFCLGESMDYLRWKILDKMNVQASTNKWLSRLPDSTVDLIKRSCQS